MKKKVTTPAKKTIITIVMDETGSMQGRKEVTISGYNEFIDSQKDAGLGECQATLVKFNSGNISCAYQGIPIADVPKMTSRDYRPTGNTPLYDALGQAITDTKKQVKNVNDVLQKLAGGSDTYAPYVVVMVMTDGEENSSTQYSREQIFQMVNECQKEGWSFVFIGADMDSWAAASAMGVTSNIRGYSGVNSMAQGYADFGRALRSNRQCYAQAVNLDDLQATLQRSSTNFYDAFDGNTKPAIADAKTDKHWNIIEVDKQ